MNIEQGDFFVVRRGQELNSDAFAFLDVMEGRPPRPASGKPKYDMSYDGYVFQALAVCGVNVAATVVVTDKGWLKKGQRLQFNGEVMELWPVTQQYVDALCDSAAVAK